MLPQRRYVSVVDSSPSPQQQKKTAEQEHDVIPARTSKTSILTRTIRRPLSTKRFVQDDDHMASIHFVTFFNAQRCVV